MSASRKLRATHFLMFIGVAQSHPGQGAANDAFLLIALLLFGYATTLVLGGTGALWSWVLTKRRIDERTTATVVLRTLVAVVLVVPLLWYASLFLRLFG